MRKHPWPLRVARGPYRSAQGLPGGPRDGPGPGIRNKIVPFWFAGVPGHRGDIRMEKLVGGVFQKPAKLACRIDSPRQHYCDRPKLPQKPRSGQRAARNFGFCGNYHTPLYRCARRRPFGSQNSQTRPAWPPAFRQNHTSRQKLRRGVRGARQAFRHFLFFVKNFSMRMRVLIIYHAKSV